MTLVKVCGLTRPEDVDVVNRVRPDMVGFVFYGPSKRNLTRGRAAELSRLVDPGIRRVGVFVDEDPLVIAGLVEDGIIDTVQLHGVEDERYIHGLRHLADVPVIKCFLVSGPGDLEAAGSCDADYIMVDAGKGSGRTFDWDLLEGLGRDFILSGGLGPGNVAEAVERLHPLGVDVSSGVETDGFKDPEKVRAFVSAARGA